MYSTTQKITIFQIKHKREHLDLKLVLEVANKVILKLAVISLNSISILSCVLYKILNRPNKIIKS